MPDQNPIYDFLKANNLTDKDEATFLREYSDSAKAKELYSFFQTNKLTDKDFNGFYDTYLKKKEPSKIGSLVGGAVGTSVPQSEEDRIASLLKTVGRSADQSPLPQEAQPEFDHNDPVKSIYAPVRNKLAELRQKPVAESVAQDPLLKRRQSQEVSAALSEKDRLDATPVFGSTNEAVGFIQDRLDPSKLVFNKPIDMMRQPSLDDVTEESIIAAIPKGNETVELGVKKYLENRKVKESIYSSSSLGEAAVKLAALKGDLTAKQVQALSGNVPKSMEANLLIGLLNDENTQELAKNDAELNSKILEAVYNLPDTHPQAAARYLIQTLSQEREDRGMNNAILNFGSQKTNDEIVDDLVKNGKLPIQYKNMYDNPAVKFFVNSKLKTPGLLENVASGIESGLTGWGKSTQETGILGSTIDNSKKQLYDALDKDYQQVALKPKSLLHDITMTGGNIIGQIIPTAAGGNYLQAAKIVTNTAAANSIAIGMQTYGDYKEQARKDMPDASEMEQTAKALLDTGVEMATENFVNDTRLVKQALSKYSPEIKDVVEKFTAKEISREAAKSQVNDIFSRVLQAAKTFGGKTAKISVGEANEEAAASILQNTNNQIFGGDPKSMPQMAEEAFDVWKTTLLGGLPLGAIGGYTQIRRNKPAAALIYEVAGNPEKYKPLIEEQAKLNEDYAKKAPEIISNIDYATKVRQSLEQREDLNETQKTKFLVASLNEKRLNDRIAETPDKTLAQKEEKELKAIEIEKKSILDPERGVQKEVQEFYDSDLLPVWAKEEMEVDGKFSSAKVGGFIKFVAQQANGLSENWEKVGDGRAMETLPPQLIDLANERWAKEIEAAQPQIDQQRDLDMGTEPVSETPSISVQMPEEVAKPEVVEPQTAETTTIPEPQPEAAKTTVSNAEALPVAAKQAETKVAETPPVEPPPTAPNQEMGGLGNEDRLDKLSNNVPDTGKIAEYLSGETIQKYTGEAPMNDQTRGIQALQVALEHGEKIIEEAKNVFGEDYVEKTLNYIERSKTAVSNKALMYVSLENALSREKLLNPEKAADISKQQKLVYEKSQEFARQGSLMLNYQRLRKFAEVGYDISKVTNSLFSTEELLAREVLNKAVEANADLINEAYVEKEVGAITPEVEKLINEGIAKEVAKIYEQLPKEKKSLADMALAALDKAQAKLRSKTYESTLGIPVAVIDAGITTIRLAIKAGVKITDAIEMGINKIKEKYGKKWDKENEFREDVLEALQEKSPLSAEEKTVKRLEKELENLQKGIVKAKGELITSPKIEELREQIFEAKKKLGLIEPKSTPSTPSQLKITETEKKIQRLEKEKSDLEEGIIRQKNASNEKPSPAQQEKIDNLRDEIFDLKKNLGLIKAKELPKTKIEKTPEEKRIDRLQKELENLESGIVKERAEKLEDTPESKELKEKIFEAKKKLGLIKSKVVPTSPNVKDIVKDALISKGFGRTVEIKGKQKQILDWKKLAGAAGTVSKISENVAEVLMEDGYSKPFVEAMKKELIDEYINIRASVIEKAQNELAKRNKETVSPEQKSAAKKLSELYTYGLFDSKFDEYENTLNKALGAKVSEQGFNDAKNIAKALDNIYKSTFKGVRLNDVSAKSAIEKLEDKLRILLFRESKSQGNLNLKAANIVRSYFDTSQTMLLNNLKQAIENPFSGLSQSAINTFEGVVSGTSNKELRKRQREAMQTIYKDMVLSGGIAYGKVESQFVNRQHLDDLVNKMSDKKLYHAIASAATGKATLNAMDSMFKASITEKKFVANLIKILTHESNPKRMTKKEALQFATERLTGQTYEEAKKTALETIKKINEDAGQELIPEGETQVERLANDIVKASLEMGGKITQEQIQAAYNAAYKSAGLNLGHEANNLLSGMMKGYSAKLEGDISKALKDKEWNRASFLIYKAVLFRNILNPFVGGGTNWLVLKMEKTGLGLFTGLAYKLGSKSDIDLSSEIGLKRLEARLYNQARYKDSFMRGLVGGVTSVLAYGLFKGLADDDEYRKFRGENPWAARYLDIVTPEMLLAEFGIKDEKFKQYVSRSFNRGDAFDPVNKIIKSVEYSVKGESGKAWGALGEGLGMKLNAPLPWRLVKDGQVIYQGVTGQDPYHGNYQPSNGFLSGVLQGGVIEWLGLRPVTEPAARPTNRQRNVPVRPQRP